MKISKLFHWLYAFLMLLPVFALIPSMFYYAFNQQAENYTYQSVSETYEYETNDVNSVSDLVVGHIYKFNCDTSDMTLANTINMKALYHFVGLADTNVKYTNVEISMIETSSNDYLQIYLNNNEFSIFRNSTGSTYYSASISQYTNFSFEFVYVSMLNLNYIDCISASDYLGEKTVTINESEQSPMNIFYTSVNKTFESPIFSWAKTSFLIAPFAYISGLFGIPSVSPLTYYLSYWLAISIIYLVFDVIMYVPLLAHRWLDKGVLE